MNNFEKNINSEEKETTAEDIAAAKNSGERKLYQIPGSTMLCTKEEYDAWVAEHLAAGVNSGRD